MEIFGWLLVVAIASAVALVFYQYWPWVMDLFSRYIPPAPPRPSESDSTLFDRFVETKIEEDNYHDSSHKDPIQVDVFIDRELAATTQVSIPEEIKAVVPETKTKRTYTKKKTIPVIDLVEPVVVETVVKKSVKNKPSKKIAPEA